MIVAAKIINISVDEYRNHKISGEKWCSGHKMWHLSEMFNKDRTRRDGLASYCREYFKVPIKKSTKGRPSPMKGRTFSEDARKNMSEAAKLRKNKHRIGAKHTAETRAKISQALRISAPRGSQCRSYKDGKVAERRGQRFTPEYKRWRYDVFLRDKFTCQRCGDNRGGNLIAHHIKSFADYEDLRFVVSNGETVCNKCHDKIHYS